MQVGKLCGTVHSRSFIIGPKHKYFTSLTFINSFFIVKLTLLLHILKISKLIWQKSLIYQPEVQTLGL